MNIVIKKMETDDEIAVWVLKNNKRAIRFYERFGYRFDGEEKTLVLGSPIVEVKMLLER